MIIFEVFTLDLTLWIAVFFQALGDLVESCMGAILLDSGFNLECVWKIMLSLLNPTKLWINPIRDLRELCQCHGMNLQFPASKKNGMYYVQVKVKSGDMTMDDCASNISKKAAKRMAAKQIFSRLKVHYLVKFGFPTAGRSLSVVFVVLFILFPGYLLLLSYRGRG